MDFEACVHAQNDEYEVLESIYPDQSTFEPSNETAKTSQLGPGFGSRSGADGGGGRILTLKLPINLTSETTVILTPSSAGSPSSGSPYPSSLKLRIKTLPPVYLKIHIPVDYPLYSPPNVLVIDSQDLVDYDANAHLHNGVGGKTEWDVESSYLPQDARKIMADRLKRNWMEMAGFDDIDIDFGSNKEGSRIETGEPVLWTWLDWISNGDFLIDCHLIKPPLSSSSSSPTIHLPTSSPPRLASLLRHHDSLSSLSTFNSNTFSCGICFEDRKGSLCLSVGCERGCVFCKECLKDCWGLAIKEGNVANVACPGEECVKARSSRGAVMEENESAENGLREDVRELSTCEINLDTLQNVVGKELKDRYVWLAEKKRVDSDPTYMICPLPHCQAPVPPPPPSAPSTLSSRSSSIRSASVFRLPTSVPAPAPDSAAATAAALTPEQEESRRQREADSWDRYRQCSKCQFSFCRYCQATWHGPHLPCKLSNASSFLLQYLSLPPLSPARLTFERRYGLKNLTRLVAEHLENEANKKWLEENTMDCPSCNSRVEKSHGCNHITCSACHGHFCYRCGTSIRPSDPYAHYKDPRSNCFEKLFDQAEIARFEREMMNGGGGDDAQDLNLVGMGDEVGEGEEGGVPWGLLGGELYEGWG